MKDFNSIISSKALILEIFRSYGMLNPTMIIEKIVYASREDIIPSPGAIFPALRYLVNKKLIKKVKYTEDNRRQGRPKVFYVITDKGMQVANKNSEIVENFFGLTCSDGFN